MGEQMISVVEHGLRVFRLAEGISEIRRLMIASELLRRQGEH